MAAARRCSRRARIRAWTALLLIVQAWRLLRPGLILVLGRCWRSVAGALCLNDWQGWQSKRQHECKTTKRTHRYRVSSMGLRKHTPQDAVLPPLVLKHLGPPETRDDLRANSFQPSAFGQYAQGTGFRRQVKATANEVQNGCPLLPEFHRGKLGSQPANLACKAASLERKLRRNCHLDAARPDPGANDMNFLS